MKLIKFERISVEKLLTNKEIICNIVNKYINHNPNYHINLYLEYIYIYIYIITMSRAISALRFPVHVYFAKFIFG